MLVNSPLGTFGIKLNKDLFFDRKVVVDAIAKANAKALPRMGAFVRQTARRSMRSRKKPAPPGSPPSAHRQDMQHPHGPLLKERLFFYFDPKRSSVVVGPEKLPGAQPIAPQVQEFGGPVKVRIIKPTTSRKPATPKQREAFLRKIKNGSISRTKADQTEKFVSVAARPFMKPAIVKEMPKFPSLYSNVISKSS